VTIGVTRDGKVYLNTTQLPADDLAPKVKDLLTGRLDKTVFIKSDQRAKYEVVLEVVQNLQAAGVDNVGLLTEQMQEKGKGESAAPAPAGQ
jgi:biopolymer transport protein ExbD